MNIFKRAISKAYASYKARKEYEAKQAEFDARIAEAIRRHKKRRHIQEERRQFVRSGLEAVSNKRVREILGAER